MKKTNNDMPKMDIETVTPDMEAATQEAPHPAEIEADRLRIELNNERIKTDALSRRCIRLGEALDAAILAEDNRVEKDMFNHINGNCYHRKAMTAANKRRKANERKMAEAFEDACTKNAIALCASALVAFGAIILGYAGFIHSAVATIVAGCAVMAFGWALNDCVSLLGRCSK